MQNTAENDLAAQRWATQMFNVVTLDTLWTRRLDVTEMTADDMSDTAEIGEKLVEEWKRATDVATHKFVRDYVLSHRGEVERAAEGTDLLDRLAQGKSDPWMFVSSMIDDLFNARESAASELEWKIATLRQSRGTPGDLPKHIIKKVMIVSAIILIILGVDPIASILAVALSWPDTSGG